MKVLLIAAVSLAVSGAAFAKDLKRSVMTDTEMDKVTAGTSAGPGFGVFTAENKNPAAQNGFNGITGNPGKPPGLGPGAGLCTANRPGAC